VLTILAEGPKHGYELITTLEERSGGRWKPSPGTIYPALRRLEHRGLIESTEDDGKRRFELTDAGRERVAERADAGEPAPWEEQSLGGHGELRRAVSELTGPARQIGRFGSSEQIDAAVAAVRTATKTLYAILADGPHAGSDTDGTDPGESGAGSSTTEGSGTGDSDIA
jgi:DNA-binding PadR family transcriptional regulator